MCCDVGLSDVDVSIRIVLVVCKIVSEDSGGIWELGI